MPTNDDGGDYMGRNKHLSWEIVEHVADIEEFSNGFTLQLNKVRWNGGEVRWDIRPWHHECAKNNRIGDGITLSEYEFREIVNAAVQYWDENDDYVEEE